MYKADANLVTMCFFVIQNKRINIVSVNNEQNKQTWVTIVSRSTFILQKYFV